MLVAEKTPQNTSFSVSGMQCNAKHSDLRKLSVTREVSPCYTKQQRPRPSRQLEIELEHCELLDFVQISIREITVQPHAHSQFDKLVAGWPGRVEWASAHQLSIWAQPLSFSTTLVVSWSKVTIWKIPHFFNYCSGHLRWTFDPTLDKTFVRPHAYVRLTLRGRLHFWIFDFALLDL